MGKRNNDMVKPFLKWAGGKRQLLPEIEKYLPTDFNDYYEPFVGGGAVFLAIQNKKTTINDFNASLINTYKVVRDDVEALIQLLKIHEEHNSSDYYYELRSWDRSDLINEKSNVELAARFIYLNKTGFNGLYRVNKKNQINVPYGKYKHPAIVNAEVLRAVSQYLESSNTEIMNGDFAAAVATAKKGDFVYFDPPYAPVVDDKSSFVSYTLNGFNDDDQRRLYATFKALDERGVYVMLSNSSVEFIHDLYADYQETTQIVHANRAINSNAKGRGKVDEVLVMNYDYRDAKQ
ncbi:DNA adenine methylase [Levilactobacillus brevis]|uniref:Site-specific DNA-methyltransferase (adenine-specific) n=1 Tax=Levilactobacillus hammesii TaxID=267633 RepID=A0A921JVT1_9LACO|nr:DNA adenine methylase [Levilactobacillus brevis]HJE86109.1 DNA adenine methylase [Levilactobacillus hammesii]